jgi:hypothetical protein
VFVPDYDRLMAAAVAVDAKRMRRMYGRAADVATAAAAAAAAAADAADGNSQGLGGLAGAGLPPLVGGGLSGSTGCNDKEPRAVAKPGKQQARAAERLSRGASVRPPRAKATTAPGAAAGDGLGFAGGPEGSGEGSGEGSEVDALGVRHAEQAAYAKQWRQRVDAQRQRRSTAVALKPTTFAFAAQDPTTGRPPLQHQPSSAHFGLGFGAFGGQF